MVRHPIRQAEADPEDGTNMLGLIVQQPDTGQRHRTRGAPLEFIHSPFLSASQSMSKHSTVANPPSTPC